MRVCLIEMASILSEMHGKISNCCQQFNSDSQAHKNSINTCSDLTLISLLRSQIDPQPHILHSNVCGSSSKAKQNQLSVTLTILFSFKYKYPSHLVETEMSKTKLIFEMTQNERRQLLKKKRNNFFFLF